MAASTQAGLNVSILSEYAHMLADTWSATPAPVATFFVAAAGTAFGAWLTSRSTVKRRVIDELKAARSAYATCQTIANQAVALKKQHIKSMRDRYQFAQLAYSLHQKNAGKRTLRLSCDLAALPMMTFPSERLLNIAFEKCSLSMQPLTIAVQVHSSIQDLLESIKLRNRLVEDFRKSQPATEFEKIAFYLGVPGPGVVDNRFKDNLEALARQVDDCITFSMLLGEHLIQYGNSIQRRYRFKFRLGFRRMFPADWDKAIKLGLVPSRDDYADWINGFVNPPSRWDCFLKAFRTGRLADWSDIF